MIGRVDAAADRVRTLDAQGPMNLLDALRIMWRVTRRDFRPDSALLYRKGKRFRLETVPVLPLQADGELLGVTPVEITVEPLAAHLLVPGR